MPLPFDLRDVWGLVPLLVSLLPGSNGSSWPIASRTVQTLVASLPDSCSPDMVLVDGSFCTEFTYKCRRPAAGRCAEYTPSGACSRASEPRRYCVDRHEWPNRVGELPLVYVSWVRAKELCNSVGKHLCSRSEWMFACEGPKRLPYPWGYMRQPSPCNVDRKHVAFDLPAMLDPATREEELARLWQADSIGSHPACVSAWGAYDMSGNVDEWTDDAADNPNTTHRSTLNGGYWGTVRDTCRLTTTSHGPDFSFYQVGFRCCAATKDGIEVPDRKETVGKSPVEPSVSELSSP